MKEEWRKAIGLEDFYEISNKGRVKSLKRKAWNGNVWHNKPERILKIHLNTHGYYSTQIRQIDGGYKLTQIHILVAMAFLDHKPDGTNRICVDHINNVRGDNRIENLQLITNRENCTKDQPKGSSKYTGVYWSTGNKIWMAAIRINGEKKHLGCFTDENKAGKAYQDALKNLE